MKKNKKILLLILSVVFITFIAQQLYYYGKYEGNLIISISNESLVDSAQLEIYIDGNKILEDRITNKITHLYKPYHIKTTMGNHVAVIKIDGEVYEDITVNTFLVTFIYVDYYGYRLDVPGCEDRKHFNISIRKRPIFYIA